MRLNNLPVAYKLWGVVLGSMVSMLSLAFVLTWVAEHYHIGLLTNSMPGFVDALRATGKIPAIEFDVIVDSSDVGAMKPESRIYEVALEKAGYSGKEILFVDDLQANLAASQRQFGWNTVWFDPYRPDISIATIRQTLEATD